MIFVKRTAALATVCLLPLISPALAGPYGGPAVIPGVGPETGRMEPLSAPPLEAQAGQPGHLGGGFIEFMMTGRSAPPRPPAAPARPYRPYVVSYAPDQGQEADYGLAEPVPALRPQPGYAAPRKAVDPIFVRQEVSYPGPQAPGTIVINTEDKFLYLVETGGRAMRYGIGVGRPGFLWSGEKTITRKAEWPDWTPPAEMIKRRPDLPPHMDGGITNPLGARAMYLGSTLYRIHGTNEPDTIGTNVSSGCIRLTNDDVTDLFGRVRVGTRVVVM